MVKEDCILCGGDGLVELPDDEAKLVEEYLKQDMRHDPRTGDELVTMLPCSCVSMSDEELADHVRSNGGNPDCGACAEVVFCGMTMSVHECGITVDVEITSPCGTGVRIPDDRELPPDYEQCRCGYDHSYEPAEAADWHSSQQDET